MKPLRLHPDDPDLTAAERAELRRISEVMDRTKAPPRLPFLGKICFGLTPFAEFKLGDHEPYLVKGLLPRSGLVVIWGPPKCGKSFWAFDLLMHVSLAGNTAVTAFSQARSSIALLRAQMASENALRRSGRPNSPKTPKPARPST